MDEQTEERLRTEEQERVRIAEQERRMARRWTLCVRPGDGIVAGWPDGFPGTLDQSVLPHEKVIVVDETRALAAEAELERERLARNEVEARAEKLEQELLRQRWAK